MTAPTLTLKLAMSIDGRIALADGSSKWITSPDSRRQAHRLRAAHDALLVGIGTAIADQPELTLRDAPGSQPVRIVADSYARLDPDSRLVASISLAPLVIAVGPDANKEICSALAERGAQIWVLPPAETGVGIALDALLARCAEAGIHSVLAEGGGIVAASLIRANLIDRLEVFRAPVIIGGDGTGSIAELGLTNMNDMPRFACHGRVELGPDMWESYRRQQE